MHKLKGAVTILPDALPGAPVRLDDLAGEWIVTDASGARVGRSAIEIEAPHAVLREALDLGDRTQALWLMRSERLGDWLALMLTDTSVRELAAAGAPGQWPLVLTGRGREADFRLTISQTDGGHRRVLETSSDRGANWSVVHDHAYRRAR